MSKMDILDNFVSTFNNAAEVIEKFISLRDHDQLGGSPSITNVHIFFMERALGDNPDYDELASGLIKHQKHQNMPVTVIYNLNFDTEFLNLCDDHISELEYTNPHARVA